MSNRIKYKWIGSEGSFVVGAPARDIREDEAAEYEEIVEANMETQFPAYKLMHRADRQEAPEHKAHEPKEAEKPPAKNTEKQ